MPHIYAHRDTVPKTMRALAKIDPGPGLKLIEALVPTPGPGEVLIRVQKTALSADATHIDRWDAWAQRNIRPPVIIGSEFVGRLVGETEVVGRPAVLPTITGQGWVTGRAEWVLDATDPFPTGYTVGDIWAPRP